MEKNILLVHMRKGKKYFTEFMKTTKNKLRDWVSKHQLIVCFFTYVVPVVVILGCHIVFAKNIGINQNTKIFEVLFESQATIVALVITLTLVAVQLTASEYSPRVVNIFRKDPHMWMLFSLYGSSMLCDGLILSKLDPFEWLSSFALLFGAFTFLALIPFILHTVNLLT